MRVIFDGGLLEHVGTKQSATIIGTLLKALVQCNLAYLEGNPKTPHPYRAGLRYQREHKFERWKSIPKVLQDRGGDCEDLAAYAAAYLIFHKVTPVRMVIRWRTTSTGGRAYHILVRGPRGLIDPSKRLGM